jgi:excisionase family DNA binding protein
MLSIPVSQLSPHHLGECRVISINEAAARTGCSVATLKRCWRRGELKVIKLSPRRIGIRLSDLDVFLAARVS